MTYTEYEYIVNKSYSQIYHSMFNLDVFSSNTHPHVIWNSQNNFIYFEKLKKKNDTLFEPSCNFWRIYWIKIVRKKKYREICASVKETAFIKAMTHYLFFLSILCNAFGRLCVDFSLLFTTHVSCIM